MVLFHLEEEGFQGRGGVWPGPQVCRQQGHGGDAPGRAGLRAHF